MEIKPVLKDKNVVMVGLGLMGGALAMALRKESPNWIGAIDTNSEVLEQALDEGVIDQGENDEDGTRRILSEADFVYFCLYPRTTVNFFKTYMKDFKSGAVITDITGVKQILVDEVLPILRDDVDFIMGHPMAGSEKEGFGGANEDIFLGHNYILVPMPQNQPENIKWLKQVIYSMGFTNIVETTPEGHDKRIGFTSQLCHVIACALIDCKEERHLSDFEGGSFMDLTRIAMINAPMWAELFSVNRDALLSQIDDFEKSMKILRTMIENQDEKGLTERMTLVRKKRVLMEIDRKNRTLAVKNEIENKKT
jgi:prephenate dehydrogenase